MQVVNRYESKMANAAADKDPEGRLRLGINDNVMILKRMARDLLTALDYLHK
jgi:hypothetical protein